MLDSLVFTTEKLRVRAIPGCSGYVCCYEMVVGHAPYEEQPVRMGRPRVIRRRPQLASHERGNIVGRLRKGGKIEDIAKEFKRHRT